MKRVLHFILLGLALPLVLPAQTALQNITYASGQNVNVSGPATITAGQAVTVASGANVTFHGSTSVRLTPGFTAQAGSYFRATTVAPAGGGGGGGGSGGAYSLTVLGGTGSAAGLSANNVVLVAAAAAPSGQAFAGWVVDAGPGTLGNSFSHGTTFTMGAGNATVRATYASVSTVDPDGDGLPAAWETLYFGNASAADPSADPDNDGLTNVAEFNRGTHPTVYNQGTGTQGNSIPEGWPNSAGGANHAANLAVGATAGELNVDKSGAATYSIPLWTTPGTAGMEPKVSLNYSSQAGPGLAGFGWSIGGVSAITRGPATLAVDGFIDGVDFDANDQFYLDGQRLIYVSGGTGHGTAGAEYRTELETFTKVVANGSTGSGPASFTAWTKAGLVIQFGHTADSAFNPGGGSSVLSWHVNRISDTSGNYMEFVYDEDTANGGHLLSRINYTGNLTKGTTPYASLRFEYENRPDYTRGFTAGLPVAQLKRLIKVSSYYHLPSDQIARTYTLGYSARSTANPRSLLTSLVEAGSDGSAYPALTFEYEEPTGGWEQAPYLTPVALAHLDHEIQLGSGIMDLDADGFADFVRKKTSNAGVLYNEAWVNRPTGWVATPGSSLPDYRIIGDAMGLAYDGRKDAGTRFADINGDGLVDVIFSLRQSNNVVANYLAINSGSGWQPNSTWTLSSQSGYASDRVYLTRGDGHDYGRRLLDINGDGLVDLVWNFDNDPNDKGCLINNTDGRYQPGGAAWVRADQWAPPHPVSGNVSSGSQFMDVNGDGLPDQVQFGLLDNAIEAGVALNTSSGWVSSPRITRPHSDSLSTIRTALGAFGKYLPPALLGKDGDGYAFTPLGSEIADLNGDGLPDMIFSNPKLSAATALHTSLRTAGAWLNTGDGWVQSTEYAPPSDVHLRGRTNGADSDPTGAVLVDLNGDGLTDLAAHRSDQTTSRYFYLNTGRGWGTKNYSYLSATDLNMPHALAHGTATAPTGTQFADLNGDGMVDSVSSDNDRPQTYPMFNKAKPAADRLKRVVNGLGVFAHISYAVLTQRDASGTPSVYTKGTQALAETANVTGPMLVVSTVSHDDGVGAQYALNYQYAGLRSHRLRGSLGFEKMTVTDSRTQIRSETTFSQTYPTIGMPVASKTIAGAVTLKESAVIYGVKNYHSNKTRFVYAQSTTETTRDLNGASLGNTTTTIANDAAIDGYGNILTITVNSDNFIKTTESEYDNFEATWLLGRLRTSQVASSGPAGYGAQVTRHSAFEYYSGTGLLWKEIVASDDATNHYKLTTTYGYDNFGNKTSVAVSGATLGVNGSEGYAISGTSTRTTTTDYDDYGRFPDWTENAKGHRENYTGYDQVKGVLTAMTGANDLPTSWTYDGFGRKLTETRADGTVAHTHYRWVVSAPTQARYLNGAYLPVPKYQVETEVLKNGANVAPPTLAFHDSFGRAFLTLGINGDGAIVYATTHYDAYGRAYAASTPYLASSSSTYWTRTTVFDALNRPVTVITPDDDNGDQTTSYTYNGLTVEVTDPKGRVARTVKNSQGWTLENRRNVTAQGGGPASTVTYTYDVLGNLLTTTADGVTTSLEYDKLGRKIRMTDADMGVWQYRYNIFGELIWQKDGRSPGKITTMAYDELGRLTQRVEEEGTTTWTYDSASAGGAWKGKLYRVEAPAGLASSTYVETYAYDALGRPVSITRRIDSNDYVTQMAYDAAGRVARTIYPAAFSSTFSTRHVYNGYGFLKEIRNWIDSDSGKPNEQLQGRVYWMADTYDVTGRVNGESYGNGLANDRVYSPATGRLVRATIDRGMVVTEPFYVQDLNYDYDAVGNVLERREDAPGFGRRETFAYDGLDRLKTHTVVGSGSVTVDYAANGNITSKSDVGSYTYYAGRPHAVENAGANTYFYDAVGNMTSGAGRSMEWTSFNQLKKVTQGTKSSEFAFGAGHERVLQVRRTSNTVTDRTVYVGALYERVLSAGGLVEHKHYILGPTGRIAVYTDRSDFTKDVRWFHTDGLGSITVITDENGRVLKRHTYDAWGKQATSFTNTGAGITNTAPSTRGFTDHEMLGDFGLVHMNGRVYDPVLGRFLSADPNVDGAEDAQGYNRYSYVGNNPMNATDPSGYFKLKDILGAIVAIVVTAVALVAICQGWGAVFTNFFSNLGFILKSGATVGINMSAAAIGGFAGGFSGSLLNGGSLGDAFKSGLIGAATGAATAWAAGQIGGFFDELGGDAVANWGGRTLAHATVGGLASEAQGGSFRHGFYSSAASAGIMHIKSVQRFFGDGRGGPWIAARTAAAAAIGGTASVLGGGKFANGAVTSAFQQLFNAEAGKKVRLSFEKKSILALYSQRELTREGKDGYDPTTAGADIFKTLSNATRGASIGVNVDEWDGKQSWENFLHDRIGDQKFDIVIFARHAGLSGASDPRMISLFSVDSALITAVAAHYSANGFIYFHQCFGVFPDSYLSQVSELFGNATVWRATGTPIISYGEVRLWNGEFKATAHQ